jgi:hypothetical protein
MGHCRPELPFGVVAHLYCEMSHAPVYKFLCFFAFHGSIVFIVIVIGIAHILIVHAEVEARIIVEYAFGLAFFVFSAVVAMTFVYLSVDFHGSILCVIG